MIPGQLQLFAINYLRFDDVQSWGSNLQTVKRDAYLDGVSSFFLSRSVEKRGAMRIRAEVWLWRIAKQVDSNRNIELEYYYATLCYATTTVRTIISEGEQRKG